MRVDELNVHGLVASSYPVDATYEVSIGVKCTRHITQPHTVWVVVGITTE